MTSSSDFVPRRRNGASGPLSGALESLVSVVDAVSATGSALLHGIGRTINMVHRGIVFRRTVSTLSSLDDRTLRDIGVARADIIRIAEEACDNWS